MNPRRPGRPKRDGPWPPCKFAGCEKTIEGGSRGFCHTHYVYARRGIIDMETGQQLREFQRVASYGSDATCSVEDCIRKVLVHGLCSPHHQRRLRGAPLETPIQPRALGPFVRCLLPDCEYRASSRGMCLQHAELRRSGILDDHGNKLREPYSMGHGRPRKERWYTRDGYILVKAPDDHPRARVDGSILEHRLVMEEALGRVLEDWEIVHHKNGDRSNNAIENLELMDGRSRHGVGHPPGSDFDHLTATQILLQRDDLSEPLREQLLSYRTPKPS